MSCETVGLSGAGSSPSDRCYSNPVTSQSPSSWVVGLEKRSLSDDGGAQESDSMSPGRDKGILRCQQFKVLTPPPRKERQHSSLKSRTCARQGEQEFGKEAADTVSREGRYFRFFPSRLQLGACQLPGGV